MEKEENKYDNKIYKESWIGYHLLCIAILVSRYQNNDGANLKTHIEKDNVRISFLLLLLLQMMIKHFTTHLHLFMN